MVPFFSAIVHEHWRKSLLFKKATFQLPFMPMFKNFALVVLLFLHAHCPEPVLLNVYGAPALIPRNEFRQPM
jgi:hypothetical protein